MKNLGSLPNSFLEVQIALYHHRAYLYFKSIPLFSGAADCDLIQSVRQKIRQIFPQLFHLIPGGGPTWLPIYFFTLVSAWCYGWRAGIVTAILSPVANSLLFGMPAAEVLPAILMKSALLAAAASFAASRVRRASLATVAAVVLAYQSIGTLGEWAICGSFIEATCDFRIGLPGMLLQAAGGWLAIHRLSR